MPDGLDGDQTRGIHSTTDANTSNERRKLNTFTTSAECGSHTSTHNKHTCATQFAECGPPSTNNTISNTKGSLGFDSQKTRQCRETFGKCQTDWMGTRQEAYIQPQTQTQQTKARKLNSSNTSAECGSHTSTDNKHTHVQLNSPNAATKYE